MEQDNATDKLTTAASRRKRIKRIKIVIIVAAILFLILPTIICIILFTKVNSLQQQIDVLMIERYGVTYNDLNKNHTELVAHAATVKDYEANKGEIDTTESAVSNGSNVNKDSEETNEAIDKVVSEDTTISIQNNQATNSKTSELSTKNASITSQNTRITSQNTSITSQNALTSNKNTVITEDEYIKTLDFNIDKEAMKSKKVYLTFDDGPSKYTEEILDILKKYNVKATFFVIGKSDSYSKNMYKKIVEEGHSIGIHSYSHVYKNIYKSLGNFDRDFTKLSNLLYDTTGYRPNIYRFPGGSGNTISNVSISNYIEYLNKNNIAYFDWNVVNGDATGDALSTKELYYNVMKGVTMHDTSIVLMHDTDTKEKTVKSLEHILKTLTDMETELLPLNKSVSPIQQVKASDSNK